MVEALEFQTVCPVYYCAGRPAVASSYQSLTPAHSGARGCEAGVGVTRVGGLAGEDLRI